MTKKMTTAIATAMVERIEALENQITDVYREANEYGMGDANVIRDAIKQRKEMRDAAGMAEGLLGSFDVEDE